MGLCWARARHSLKVTRLPVVRREGCSFQHSTDRQTDAGRAGRRWKGRQTLEGQADAGRAGRRWKEGQADAGRAGRRWKGRLDYKGKRIVFKIKLMLQVFATKAVRT